MVFNFVGRLPDLEQANGRVKAVENGQRHGNVDNHSPSPDAEEVEVGRSEGGMSFDKRVDEPQRHICYQQEGDNLSPRFSSILLGSFASSPAGVQHKKCLHRGLQQGQYLSYKAISATW